MASKKAIDVEKIKKVIKSKAGWGASIATATVASVTTVAAEFKRRRFKIGAFYE